MIYSIDKLHLSSVIEEILFYGQNLNNNNTFYLHSQRTYNAVSTWYYQRTDVIYCIVLYYKVTTFYEKCGGRQRISCA